MTVQVWYGREPNGYEADALRKLVAELEKTNVKAHIFVSFQVGGHEIDALVVKPDGMFLCELKQAGGPVMGAVNGEWKVLNGGSEYLLAGGRNENPYQQMLTQYRVLTEWLESRKWDFLSSYSANVTRFRPLNYRERGARRMPRVQIRSLLVFYPALPNGSQLDIEWPIKPVSFTELPDLLRQTTKRVNLTDEEIVAMAQALHLTRWEERGGPRPPAHRRLHPAPLWLPPAGISVRNAWLQIVLFAVTFLAQRLTAYREQLLVRLQPESPADSPEGWGARQHSHATLRLTTPPQPQLDPIATPSAT